MHLVGDFNNWAVGSTPMTRVDGTLWISRLSLPQGTYRFRYVADGQWFTDFAAFGVESGPLGINSVLQVGPRGMAETSAAPARRTGAGASPRPQGQPSEPAYV